MCSHRMSEVIRDGMWSEVNRIYFHLTEMELSDNGLPQHRVTTTPNPMQKVIRCVMNPASCNWGLISLTGRTTEIRELELPFYNRL